MDRNPSAESKFTSYAQIVIERKHLGQCDPTIHPQKSVCAFETMMQNGTPTTTDVDSGRLRVKKTNRPLPRCADEDLGFGTVRARYSQAVGKEGGARPPCDLLSKTEWITATDARLRRFLRRRRRLVVR